MTVEFTGDARRRLEALNRKDKVEALLDGAKGAAARFRLAHGHLAHFALEEIIRDPESEPSAVAWGYLPNFCTAAVSFAMNTEHPDETLRLFLGRLVLMSIERLKELQSGQGKGGDFYTLREDKVADFDFRDEFKP